MQYTHSIFLTWLLLVCSTLFAAGAGAGDPPIPGHGGDSEGDSVKLLAPSQGSSLCGWRGWFCFCCKQKVHKWGELTMSRASFDKLCMLLKTSTRTNVQYEQDLKVLLSRYKDPYVLPLGRTLVDRYLPIEKLAEPAVQAAINTRSDPGRLIEYYVRRGLLEKILQHQLLCELMSDLESEKNWADLVDFMNYLVLQDEREAAYRSDSREVVPLKLRKYSDIDWSRGAGGSDVA